MESSDKEIKKMIREWGNIGKINEMKANEILIFSRLIAEGNRSIEIAENEIRRIEREISDKIESNKKFDEILNKLSSEEQEIIYLRYRKGCEWAAVARVMYISERQVFNIHKSALHKIKKTLID